MSRRVKILLTLLAGFGLVALLFFGALSWFVVEVTRPDAAAEPAPESAPERPAPSAAPEAAPFAVAGRVVFEGGEPAPGVAVRGGRSGEDLEAVTDADGRFALEASGPLTVRPDSDLSRPWEIEVDAAAEDLLFVIPPRCPLLVTVVDATDAPVAEAAVWASPRDGLFHSRGTGKVNTDVDGRARLEDLSCAVADLRVVAGGRPPVRLRDVDVQTRREVLVRLAEGVLVTGFVSDPDGERLAEVELRAGESRAESDDEGAYELLVDPRRFHGVRASKDGYRDQTERLRIASDDPGPVPLDIVLEAARRVTVFCKGLPENSCASVEAMSCTRTWLPFGSICSGDPKVCDCPWGNAAVRGGGATAHVLPGVNTVWLDMTTQGGIAGLVRLDDEPAPCEVLATRLPESFEDIKHGLAGVRKTSCTPGGSFGMTGLSPGGWSIEVISGEVSRRVTRVEVADTIVDLGTIDLDGGGEIRGVVRDGLTGDPAAGEVVVALMKLDDPKAPPPMGQAFSGPGGVFRIRGLEDGPYEVILASKPMEKEAVEVVNGEGARELELETAGGGLLDRQGFEVESDVDGALVVSAVEPGGAAAEAGLLPGDRIEAITIMGIDLAGQIPELGDLITDFVLDRFGGAVGLIVERDGERVKIDL